MTSISSHLLMVLGTVDMTLFDLILTVVIDIATDVRRTADHDLA